MGRGISTLQRDLLALADAQRKSQPVSWRVSGSAPIPAPLAEQATERGRALYDHMKRIFDPSTRDIFERIKAPHSSGSDLYYLDIYWTAWRVITALERVSVSDPQWVEIMRLAGEPASYLNGDARAVLGSTLIAMHKVAQSATELPLLIENRGLHFYTGVPMSFLSLAAANAYAAELRERAPVIEWAAEYAVPNALAWHVRVADAMDAIYGPSRDPAADNRARVAVSRSIQRLESRGYVVTSVGYDKQALAGASYSLTWDGWSALHTAAR